MLTRGDIAWIAALALLALVALRLVGFDWLTAFLAAVLVSLGRLAYAIYARRTWRR